MTADLLERIDVLLPHHDHPAHARAGQHAAGAALRETLEAPDMSDPDVLGVLMDRLTEVGRAIDAQSAAINSQAVAFASLAGEVRTLMTRVDSSERDRDDHEHRIRELEHRPVTDERDHEDRLRKIERMIWIAAGGALAGGGLIGTVAGKLLGG